MGWGDFVSVGGVGGISSLLGFIPLLLTEFIYGIS